MTASTLVCAEHPRYGSHVANAAVLQDHLVQVPVVGRAAAARALEVRGVVQRKA